jgi:carbohydrate kinase (thermoresistant glucokinase family)
MTTPGAPSSAGETRSRFVVVMGVCGCGKTVIGEALAARLDLPFLEGDAFHPAKNIARMRAGIPLSDANRAEWLKRLGDALLSAHGTGAVLACSALKRRYRDLLRSAQPDLRLVFLHGRRELIKSRMAGRAGHYMPASLLDSQLADLEPPQTDEPHCALDIERPVEEIVDAACDDVLTPLGKHP